MGKIRRRILNRELRKAKADLASLSQYLEDCESLLEEYLIEWSRDFSYILKNFELEKDQSPKEKTGSNLADSKYFSFENKNEKILEAETINSPSWVKKAFRKIAMKTHPDKIIGDSDSKWLISLYEKANKAVSDGDYEAIIDICRKLKIESDIDPELELKTVRKKQEIVKKRLKDIDKSYAWVWGESYGSIEARVNFLKEVLVRHGVKELDEIKIFSLVTNLESS